VTTTPVLPPIPLNPAPKPSRQTLPVPEKKHHEPKDSVRDLIETIVFVVVLVLMLKTFLAEAFVIPTGSMAVTLLGYHFKHNCEQCGRPNLVNASQEADAESAIVVSYECENCGQRNILRELPPGGQQ
jgi:signal peptidase I